jgi:phosphatidylglycerophosphatase A
LLLLAGLAVAAWSVHHIRRPEKTGDASWIVIDEVLGIWAVLLPLGPMLSPSEWFAAFLLFRLFDILKPPPAKRLERSAHTGHRHGWPILLDDLVASVWTVAILGVWWAFGM